jgi:transcriptional regulator with XRE-family HTH domain
MSSRRKENTEATQRMWEEFGTWVRKGRRAADLTQAAVAKGVGLSTMQVLRIEKGYGGTRRETVVSLADFLGLNRVEALLRSGFAAAELDDETWRLIGKLCRRSPNERQQIENFINFLAASGGGEPIDHDPGQRVHLRQIDEGQQTQPKTDRT